MKNSKKIIILIAILISFNVSKSNAQAFQAKNLNIDLGYVIGSHRGAFYSPGVMLSIEKGIHKWIGIGVYGGVQYNLAYLGWGGVYGGNSLSVPLGATGSFHFYQMISDLVGKEIGSNKLDLAAKLSLGTRLDFENPLTLRFDWGTSVTARYFFTEKFGVYAEVGYPAMGNLIAGVALKF